jgi:hypothetical protein
MERKKRPWIIRPDYVPLEYGVKVEYTAHCVDCGFNMSDSTKDTNEKDALANAKAICEGWHYTENRMKNTTCDQSLVFETKTTHLK